MHILLLQIYKRTKNPSVVLQFNHHITAIRAVRFQKFYLGFGFFGTKKPWFGSVSFIFKKEEQYKCMNSFMYVSSIFTK
jgi:hypothetical protein